MEKEIADWFSQFLLKRGDDVGKALRIQRKRGSAFTEQPIPIIALSAVQGHNEEPSQPDRHRPLTIGPEASHASPSVRRAFWDGTRQKDRLTLVGPILAGVVRMIGISSLRLGRFGPC